MTRKVKRKLDIENKTYFWVVEISNLDLYPFKGMHIRVHQNNKTKSLLYIDANAWHFEIKPSDIKEAVVFALANGWKPENANSSICVSKNELGYFILPPNTEHAWDIES